VRIVLVIPPSPFLLDDRAFPFLGPLQISALARELGHDVNVADLTGYKQRNPNVIHANYDDVMHEAKQRLSEHVKDADLVGFYSLAAQHPQVVKLHNFVKQNFGCITALGGPHANTTPERCLDDGFDYVVVADQGGGGGEQGFLELLNRVSNNKKYLSNGRIIKIPSRSSNEIYLNDKWPLPARDLIDLNSYYYYINGERATSIVSTTGCPFACSFSVTGDTLIFTDRGFERIDSLIAGQHEVKACNHGGHILRYKSDRIVSTHLGQKTITYAIKEGIRPVFHIKTDNGLIVKATKEHLFLSVDHGQLIWKSVGNLKIGDWLVLKSPDHKWPHDYVKIPSPHPITKFANGPRVVPSFLTEDVAWLTGFIIGDGCLPADGRPAIHFSVTPKTHWKLIKIIKNLFGVRLKTYKTHHTKKCRHGWVYGRAIYDFFVKCLGISPSSKLRIPELIRQSPKSVVESFIDGLLDADGYSGKGRTPYLTTVSNDLAVEFSQLLLMLGKTPYIHHCGPYDSFSARSHYRVGYYAHDRIPTKKALYKSPKSDAWYWRTPRKKSGFLGVRRTTLNKSGLLHQLNIDGYHYVRVSSITTGISEPVYDLEVLGDHSFLANGFISHNCSHWDGYRKLEMKSPKRINEEIKLIKSSYGWNSIMFYDDEINLRSDFKDEFLNMLRDAKITWRAFFKNGKNLTIESIFKLMAESGCVQLCTGAESADPKILRDTKKGATLEDNTNFVKYCVKYGINAKLFTQVGLPGESPETIEALRIWLIQMANEGLADADVSITTPYEGTPLFNNPEKFDIHFDKDKLDYSNDQILYKGTPGEYQSWVWHDKLSKEDIVSARQMIEDEFRKAAGLKPLLAKDDG
jgi:radical SAM superfamily enzyme YgiQ (UPF0313 family)/intein/homing endonuclease